MLFGTQQAYAYDMNMDLPPKSDKALTNSTFSTIHATCHIHSSDSKKTIKIRGVKNKSQVNGQELAAGQTKTVTIYADKTVKVTAEPGAEVNITNTSDESVTAVCSS